MSKPQPVEEPDEEARSKVWIESEPGSLEPFAWGKGYELQVHDWGRRLLCSTDGDRIDFFLRLAGRYPGPFGFTYILEDSCGGAYPEGRYVYGDELSQTQLEFFLRQFGEFLSWDGRHHLMLYCRTTSATIVYDQHDYYFVYGRVEELLRELEAEGHAPTSFVLGQHGHKMESDSAEFQRLMEFWPWIRQPLEITDTTPERVGWWQFTRMKIRAWWFKRTRKAPG